jgi:energy-coupling factor transporter ATP-binding protein EcfA2
MAVYQEIINWSNNKPGFIKDALRRLINQPNMADSDIDELVLLLKKEVGFTGISLEAVSINANDIPSEVKQNRTVTKLLSIENPVNINALYSEAKLDFAENGLTVVYGNNGSGKSGYARLLKKICWSRQKEIEIKKNVFAPKEIDQTARINFSVNGIKCAPFMWKERENSDPVLNSVFVFDSNCANIYLNNENATEYKPVGIDLLEKLVDLCNRINNKIEAELNSLVAVKPILDKDRYSAIESYRWYQNIESLQRKEIQDTLIFTDEKKQRLSDLIELLKTSNPTNENNLFSQRKARYKTVEDNLLKIELALSAKNIEMLAAIHADFIIKKEAYEIAQQTFKGEDPLTGIGSETWRMLWETARKYAITEIHPEKQNFPSDKSAEFCVLCQQPLTLNAKQRLKRFDAFVQDATSKEFVDAKKIIDEKISEINDIVLNVTDTYEELKIDIEEFDKRLILFQDNLTLLKNDLIIFLQKQDKSKFSTTVKTFSLSEDVQKRIDAIERQIENNIILIASREKILKEALELEIISTLTKEKEKILRYYDENVIRYLLNQCKSKTNTSLISKKIGDLMDSEVIQLQLSEFMKHLKSLSPNVAEKVTIRKTKTKDGKSYHKCLFISKDINEPISTIFSEGEQKIIALANFLSECTIDGALNSIVFDDPVTSLDQDYRETIVNSIVALAKNRQVIVLTHDLYFVRSLMDLFKSNSLIECYLQSLESYKGISGIVTDEIPYLAKNVQQRIETINKGLDYFKSLDASSIEKVERVLDQLRKRMRMLMEKAVEEILANKSIQRFSKNINVKQSNLANFVVVEKQDIEFILTLFGKYSKPEHDGDVPAVYSLPDENEIKVDLRNFSDWKDGFNVRVKAFKDANGYK